MKQNRKTLEPYYGTCVEITGMYKENYNNVKFVWNETFCTFTPKTFLEKNPQTGLIYPGYFVDKEKLPDYTQAFEFIDAGSVIKNVIGINGFYIMEDHMIIQCNIAKTYNIPAGNYVKIYGLVGAYKANNKCAGYDYGIVKLENVQRIDTPSFTGQ